jgi:hypothetical protein
MQKQWLNQYWRQGFRAMPPRNVHEHHRASTPLELLFDLVAVITIAVGAGIAVQVDLLTGKAHISNYQSAE